MCYNARHARCPAQTRAGPVFRWFCALSFNCSQKKTSVFQAGFGGSFLGFHPLCRIDCPPRSGSAVPAADAAVRSLLFFWCPDHVGLSYRLREISYRSVECIRLSVNFYHDVRSESLLRSVGIHSAGPAQQLDLHPYASCFFWIRRTVYRLCCRDYVLDSGESAQVETSDTFP